jgi:hypothetical protein
VAGCGRLSALKEVPKRPLPAKKANFGNPDCKPATPSAIPGPKETIRTASHAVLASRVTRGHKAHGPFGTTLVTGPLPKDVRDLGQAAPCILQLLVAAKHRCRYHCYAQQQYRVSLASGVMTSSVNTLTGCRAFQHRRFGFDKSLNRQVRWCIIIFIVMLGTAVSTVAGHRSTTLFLLKTSCVCFLYQGNMSAIASRQALLGSSGNKARRSGSIEQV